MSQVKINLDFLEAIKENISKWSKFFGISKEGIYEVCLVLDSLKSNWGDILQGQKDI